MLEIYEGPDFVALELSHTPFYIYPIIPSHGIVLFHGSPGIGKTTLMWQMANCLEGQTPFLGLTAQQTRVLFINLDMPMYGLHERWRESNFNPLFDIAFCDDFDCTAPGFIHTPTFKKLQVRAANTHYGVVIVDCLGHILTGKSIKNDEMPNLVYSIFNQWFPNSCIIIIHHDRKRKQTEGGELGPATEEDFLGSQFWKSSAQIQLHLYKVNKHVLRLHHAKSQLSKQLDEEIDLYMDDNGTALEIWSEHKQKEEAGMLVNAEITMQKRHADWKSYSMKKKMELLSEFCGKSIPTIYRWRKSLESGGFKP